MPYPKGTCRGCGGEPAEGRSLCAPCAKRRRAVEAAQREERRAKKKCITCGASVEKGRRYCATHLAYYAERWRAAHG